MTEQWINLDDVELWEENPNEGDVGAIITSVLAFGYNGAIYLWNKTMARGGNHMVMALRQLRQIGWEMWGDSIREGFAGGWEIKYIDISHLSKKQADAFGVALNQITRRGRDDPARVLELLGRYTAAEDVDLFVATGYDEDILDDMLREAQSPAPLPEKDETPVSAQAFTAMIFFFPAGEAEKMRERLLRVGSRSSAHSFPDDTSAGLWSVLTALVDGDINGHE